MLDPTRHLKPGPRCVWREGFLFSHGTVPAPSPSPQGPLPAIRGL